MKNFSASHKMGIVERIHSPMAGKRLLYTQQYTIPNLPPVIVSFEEEIHEEACPYLLPSNEMVEDDLFFTVKEGMHKQPRRALKQTWSSPFLEKQALKKPLERSHSVNTISLEATGRQIPRQNHPLSNSKGDSGPVLRPSTAIGLCRSISHNSPCSQIRCKTSSESEQQDQVKASGSSTNAESLSICGSALGRASIPPTPETTPKLPHPRKEHRSKAVSAFRGRAAKEPLPLLVGSSTHLFSKKLMKNCSSADPRPPQRFLKACSQTLSRPVVNAVVNAHLH